MNVSLRGRRRPAFCTDMRGQEPRNMLTFTYALNTVGVGWMQVGYTHAVAMHAWKHSVSPEVLACYAKPASGNPKTT